MIQVGDNFDHKSKKPLDARTSYATLALMKAVTDANIYEGCEAYCVETDKYYMFKSTNTVDADTGKWREREDSAGHVIEDSEGTALTQRDTMQFGEGFSVEDDSTNEKTVISPDVMQSGDMDDVVTPLPSVQSRYHRYSTEEQIVGTWIDGRNIYEKTVEITTPTVATEGIYVYNHTQLGVSIDKAIMCKVITSTSDGNNIITPDEYGNRTTATISGTQVYSNAVLGIRAFIRTNSHSANPNTISIGTNATVFSNRSGYAIVQYIKTTD